MTKICPKCHTTNRQEARFCLQCNYAFQEAEIPAVRLCPAGRHPMDPAWSACPYCAGSFGAEPPSPPPPPKPPGERKRAPTEIERPAGGASYPPVPETNPVPPPSPSPPPSEAKSRPKTSFHAAIGQTTQVTPPGGTPAASVPATPQAPITGRRIVAVLVTYSWLPDGQIFPLYEGRNYIGRDADCEVSLAFDERLSGRHAAIFFRGEFFEVTDERSMNGTFLNGKSVPLTGALALPNYATLRTGDTVWRFVVIAPTSELESQMTSRI